MNVLILINLVAIVRNVNAGVLPADWMSRLDPQLLEEGLRKAEPSETVLAELARTSFHGDINVQDQDMRADDSGEKSPFLLGQLQPENFWPARQDIPYQISLQFNSEEALNIVRAMQGISKRTFNCIGFRQRSNEPDYLYFQKTAGVCRSSVGRRGGKQAIDLAPTCARTLGNIQHEIMHSLGIFHEQSRPDRDAFVLLNQDNIVSLMLDNFEKLPLMETYNVGYDLNSVMHYGFNDFARNKSGPTIIPLKLSPKPYKMGQRNGLSLLDATKLQMAYGCPFDNDPTTAVPTTQKPKILNDDVGSPTSSCGDSSAWKAHGHQCYFFSFLSDANAMKSFAKAIADCRKRGAKIGDPQDDPDVISFITNVISDNPAADPARKIWVSGCRTLASGNTDTQEGDSCSVELHYVCETHVKKKRVN